MANSKVMEIPQRDEIKKEDKWDLSSLYKTDQDWEKDFSKLNELIPQIASFKGTLGKSVNDLFTCLQFKNEMELLAERLGYYAHLRTAENLGESDHQSRMARYMQVAVKAEAEFSFFAPEIQEIPEQTLTSLLQDPKLQEFQISIKKLTRFKDHILSMPEERLLSLQSESAQTASKTFGALTDVDMDFGTIETEAGKIELSNSSYGQLMIHQDRSVREKAFTQFHEEYENHKNTLTNLYAGSVNQDIFRARARNYASSLEAALFPDDVPETVYKNLIKTVNDNLPILHSYYKLRKRILKLDDFSLWDTKVPLLKDFEMITPYDSAVNTIVEALEPLGKEYTGTLREGLIGSWVDKYENKGKRSGAFSAGSFVGEPYILMNYKENVLRDLFTLAHEGGHSMHSWYSARNNPFQHYNYTIFEAEVASTFNEQLLFHHLYNQSDDKKLKAFLLNKQIDDILATLFRQTMFAEFELKCHEDVEQGQPLTVDSIRAIYRTLLEKYFGPEVTISNPADMEGLRIPHFYRAFYVYKYATGISAAISLSEGVLNGGTEEKEKYFKFLKSGGSRYPIESLSLAGVDLSQPEPIVIAIKKFGSYIEDLEKMLS